MNQRSTRYCLAIIALLFTLTSLAAPKEVVNVYTWAEEIPASVIAAFEKETGIKVNAMSFESNEAMYAKLRASKNLAYDIIEPSSYYIDRMRHLGMLEPLDKNKLPEFKHLDSFFLNLPFDPQSQFSVPFIWGVTGIFVNKNYFPADLEKGWSNLLDAKYRNQLMLLDDPREAFSIGLLMLGYSVNDRDPAHIKQAYLKLRELMPNIRLFNTDAVISILIDEDATIGTSWNGDLFKACLENPKLSFVYPKDGFEIWVDSFAILKTAPHKSNAYKFLNFMLRPEIAKVISLNINYSTANLTAKNSMPAHIKNNPTLYPPQEVLRHGEFQTDIGDKTFALYEKYWEQLKMEA